VPAAAESLTVMTVARRGLARERESFCNLWAFLALTPVEPAPYSGT
jgi:hypothetical protein